VNGGHSVNPVLGSKTAHNGRKRNRRVLKQGGPSHPIVRGSQNIPHSVHQIHVSAHKKEVRIHTRRKEFKVEGHKKDAPNVPLISQNGVPTNEGRLTA
jgi:hypothetical protein